MKQNNKTINIPDHYIDRTVEILKSCIVFYYQRFTNSTTLNSIKTLLNIKSCENHTLINTDKNNVIISSTIDVVLNEFDYPIHSNPYYQTNGSIKVRIEVCFSNRNESTFHIKNDSNGNKLARIRFNVQSIVNVIESIINNNTDRFKIDSVFNYYHYTIRHEWIHIIQSFVLHHSQRAMKANYSFHGNDYYTSYAERLPMLESACGEFQTIVSNNEFWSYLSKEDKMKFVYQFIDMNYYDSIHVVIQDQPITIDGRVIKPHKLFTAYRETKPQTYPLIVKKFIAMIEPIL